MVSPGDLDDDRLTAAGAGAQVRVRHRPEAPSDRGTDRCIHGRPSRWAAGLELDLHVPSSGRTWGLLFDSTVPVTAAMLKYENGGEAANWFSLIARDSAPGP
jgi:hypothetical protein